MKPHTQGKSLARHALIYIRFDITLAYSGLYAASQHHLIQGFPHPFWSYAGLFESLGYPHRIRPPH